MQALDEKVIIFKKKRRKNYRRTTGHRQVGTEPYRCLLVLDVCSGLLGIPKRYFLRFCTPKDQTVSGFFFSLGASVQIFAGIDATSNFGGQRHQPGRAFPISISET